MMKNQSKVAVASVRRSSSRNSVRRGKKPSTKSASSGSKVSVRRGAKAKKDTEGKATKEAKVSKQSLTKTKRKEEKQARRVLEPGNAIASPNHKYTVVKLLGSGGFGDVYKVEDEATHVKLALKTEFYGSKMPRLKIEAYILEKCSVAPKEKRRHFLTLRDKGTTEDFKFMCMEVVGPSLEAVRKSVCGSEFSKGTALNITKQTLQAIWDLHSLGFLHRDIKPANFSIGLSPDDETLIYVLDFGIAREYKTSSGEIRNPRPKVPFCGTPRYAARACHKKEEQSPKDDLETWCYMVFDVFDCMSLPWKKDVDREKILKKKEELMSSMKSPTKRCPKDFMRIVKYINELNYIDVPDYRWIRDLIDDMVKENKVDASNEALDWVGKIKNEKAEKAEEVSYAQTGEDQQEDEDVPNKPKPSQEGLNY